MCRDLVGLIAIIFVMSAILFSESVLLGSDIHVLLLLYWNKNQFRTVPKEHALRVFKISVWTGNISNT